MADVFEDRRSLIDALAFSLTRSGRRLATAESCTGGMIAAMCTDVPGSSEWFVGGVVAYADAVKSDLLDVPAGLIATHGAVSGEVAERMALGCLARCKAQAAIAVSGVAGPSGGSLEKPVGTVWVAVAATEEAGVCRLDLADAVTRLPGCSFVRGVTGRAAIHSMRHQFAGSREEVRQQSANKALRDLLVLLNENGA